MKECKNCKRPKEYIYSHLNTQGRKVYRDSQGNPWNGKTCPECRALELVKFRKDRNIKLN